MDEKVISLIFGVALIFIIAGTLTALRGPTRRGLIKSAMDPPGNPIARSAQGFGRLILDEANPWRHAMRSTRKHIESFTGKQWVVEMFTPSGQSLGTIHVKAATDEKAIARVKRWHSPMTDLTFKAYPPPENP